MKGTSFSYSVIHLGLIGPLTIAVGTSITWSTLQGFSKHGSIAIGTSGAWLPVVVGSIWTEESLWTWLQNGANITGNHCIWYAVVT